MSRVLSILLWTAVFLLLLLGVDQLLVRLPARHPAHVAVADFYRDLRGRVLDLARTDRLPSPVPAPAAAPKSQPERSSPPATIEGVIGQARTSPPAPVGPVPPTSGGPSPRYVYADEQGELHFAATLEEVPAAQRGKAKRLGK